MEIQTPVRPCPFCGAPAVVAKSNTVPDDWEFAYNWFIKCDHEQSCGLAPMGENHFACHKTEAGVIAAWNGHRALTQPRSHHPGNKPDHEPNA